MEFTARNEYSFGTQAELLSSPFTSKATVCILLLVSKGLCVQKKQNNPIVDGTRVSVPTKGQQSTNGDLGHKYFKELLSRSFFQPVANDESLGHKCGRGVFLSAG